MEKSEKNFLNCADLLAVAKRVVWFEDPEDSLRDANRFLAYLMTYGTLEEVLIAKKYFSDETFASALRNAPPGIFDIRSWTYWNLHYGRDPIPPLPQRQVPGLNPAAEFLPDSLPTKK